MKQKFVKMKPLKTLIRQGHIAVREVSDDGEFVRFKVLPDGPIVGMFLPDPGERVLVVDCETIHINQIKMMPWAYEEV